MRFAVRFAVRSQSREHRRSVPLPWQCPKPGVQLGGQRLENIPGTRHSIGSLCHLYVSIVFLSYSNRKNFCWAPSGAPENFVQKRKDVLWFSARGRPYVKGAVCFFPMLAITYFHRATLKECDFGSCLVYGGQNLQSLYARYICAQENCQHKFLQRIQHVPTKRRIHHMLLHRLSFLVAHVESVSSPLPLPLLCIFDPRMRNGCERDRVSTVTLRTLRRRGRGRSGRSGRVLRLLRGCRALRALRGLRGLRGLGVLGLGLVCALSQLSQMSPSFVATFKTSLQATAAATTRTNRTGLHKIHKIHKSTAKVCRRPNLAIMDCGAIGQDGVIDISWPIFLTFDNFNDCFERFGSFWLCSPGSFVAVMPRQERWTVSWATDRPKLYIAQIRDFKGQSVRYRFLLRRFFLSRSAAFSFDILKCAACR